VVSIRYAATQTGSGHEADQRFRWSEPCGGRDRV
jgi:hypothetical protein